ncbi:MAG: phenylpyruvate tautomerase MIF-related protein [Sandaracinaceae bacterium]
MPTAHVHTDAPASDEARARFATELSRAIAEVTGKPEKWVMTIQTAAQLTTFGGAAGESCYVRVVSIGGFTSSQAEALIAQICRLVEAHLEVPGARTYVELGDAEPHLFGHAGRTFA